MAAWDSEYLHCHLHYLSLQINKDLPSGCKLAAARPLHVHACTSLCQHVSYNVQARIACQLFLTIWTCMATITQLTAYAAGCHRLQSSLLYMYSILPNFTSAERASSYLPLGQTYPH